MQLFKATHLVVISPHDMHIRRDRAQVFVCFPVTDVPSAEDLLYLARHEQLLKLEREVMYSVRYVEIADDEYEDHGGSRESSSTPSPTAGSARASAVDARCTATWHICHGRLQNLEGYSPLAAEPLRPPPASRCSSPAHRWTPLCFLIMAHSLSEECTPLKRKYDACFNAWFEGYLEPAVSASVTPEQRTKFSQEKAAEFERSCGAMWREYRDCVQVHTLPACSSRLRLDPPSLYHPCRKR